MNKKSTYIITDYTKNKKKPKITTFTVTRIFSGTKTFEELLAQVIRDHS